MSSPFAASATLKLSANGPVDLPGSRVTYRNRSISGPFIWTDILASSTPGKFGTRAETSNSAPAKIMRPCSMTSIVPWRSASTSIMNGASRIPFMPTSLSMRPRSGPEASRSISTCSRFCKSENAPAASIFVLPIFPATLSTSGPSTSGVSDPLRLMSPSPASPSANKRVRSSMSGPVAAN